jgi:hypothetical protein
VDLSDSASLIIRLPQIFASLGLRFASEEDKEIFMNELGLASCWLVSFPGAVAEAGPMNDPIE